MTADAEIASHGVGPVSLEKVFGTADYVSMHCPQSETSYHLIGERELGMMQPHALLINTARGVVVDEAALIGALQAGRLAGAALDVLETEPPAPDNPLLSMDNVILTPHTGGDADDYPDGPCEASVEALIDLAEHRWPRHVVNPQVKPRWGELLPKRWT